ncbi:xanthine dehydrogenase family protein molybdopterin-binding subunit [Dongia soli]|uniref:Xanthine dehydrogenase family protein molybdopterin-binding subunit n=1 Tax=Dongia soli TaxID=600628 RepID=A0ABU5E5Z5_9PROT|nr:xanthine dehydrogenase family protein molybdopterin-binding subunit [Dongia soli]MDY0881671.1 xanthine dehydrogenase family protein molybdopterin-binding subunit [Dongia soli]
MYSTLQLKTAAKPELPAPLIAGSRRAFLKASGAIAGTLVIGLYLPAFRGADAADLKDPPAPNAFVKIAPDSTVTVIIKHLDKGQGVTTGLTTIVAEELDADWSQMRSEFAPADAKLYNNLFFGPVQATGGSTSVANSWMQLRQAGAAAREMLVGAAAADWNVPAGEITVRKGVISHASGKTGSFGDFAAKAATLPVPQQVTLKDPKNFTLIGQPHLPRIDSVDKTTGKAIYALDVRRPNMKTAVLLHPPRFGGLPGKVDDTAARKVPGVVDVVTTPQGVAVIAENTWAAMQGREALKVTWDDSKAEMRSTAEMVEAYKAMAAKPGAVAVKKGDIEQALSGAAKTVEADFVFPYLAHAPMEPLNCIIEKKADGSVECWAGSQFQTVEQMTVAQVFGIKPEQVKINTVWAGGSFGRRATPNADYFGEAAAIVKATDGKYPVHLVYSREDDIRGGRYRPMFYHKLRGGLDKDGNLVAWEQRLVGQSFMIGSPFEKMMVKDGVDATAVEGAADMPYAVPAIQVDWHHATSPITTLWWRSVGHTHTAQAVEVMMDELAHEAGKDPVEFRLALLKDHPRHVGVLKLAAEKAGWSKGKLPAGRGRGVAVHESFNSYVAMVAEVTAKDGTVKVDRVVAAVDCGIAVNPDVIKAQVEGGIGYALGAALRNQITMTKGVVDQANFDTYEPLRLSDMPAVEVHIVDSSEAPTGIGEPGVPPLAPAVSNAIFNATGKRLRSLPFDLQSLQGA